MDFNFISYVYGVLPFVFVISVLVYFHELGHYWVARYHGVHVEAFSIGFGPQLFGWTNRHGTRWKVCLIPLGGYVKPRVDEAYEEDPQSKIPDPLSLSAQKPGVRILVAIAGPFANYLLAVLVLAGIYIIDGQRVPTGHIQISNIYENSAAEKAGLRVGDVILDDDGVAGLRDVAEFQRKIRKSPGKALKINVRGRDKEGHAVTITPDVIPQKDALAIGRIGAELFPESTIVRHTVYSGIKASITNVYSLTRETLALLGKMLSGARTAVDLMGPIGIGKAAKDFADQGFVPLMTILAILSVNLGLVNLFPIPMLDGGHIMFYLIEWVRGKPASKRVQEIALAAGFLVVVGLFLFSTWNDLSRLKVIQFFKDLF